MSTPYCVNHWIGNQGNHSIVHCDVRMQLPYQNIFQGSRGIICPPWFDFVSPYKFFDGDSIQVFLLVTNYLCTIVKSKYVHTYICMLACTTYILAIQ